MSRDKYKEETEKIIRNMFLKKKSVTSLSQSGKIIVYVRTYPIIDRELT